MRGLHESFAAESAYKSTYGARSDYQRSFQLLPPLTSDEQNTYVATYKTLIKQIVDLNKTGKAKSLDNAKE